MRAKLAGVVLVKGPGGLPGAGGVQDQAPWSRVWGHWASALSEADIRFGGHFAAIFFPEPTFLLASCRFSHHRAPGLPSCVSAPSVGVADPPKPRLCPPHGATADG